MGEKITVQLPKLGESIVGATIVKWLKHVGDPIALDEPLVEVATDKVNSEIPSPIAGILQEILAQVDEQIEVGAPLVSIEIQSGQSLVPSSAPLEKVCPLKEKAKEYFSPAVLNLARQEGIDLESIKGIPGSGEGGRVTKKDLEQYIENKPSAKNEEFHLEERIKISGMRKAIADNMVRSFYEAPHASLVMEVDVTDVMQLIAKEKERFLKTHGVKLTITSFIAQALGRSISQFPMLNASVKDETIIMKRYINIGIAVHVDKGLVVPVIKHCQERNLVSLAKAIGELSAKARAGKLAPDDVSDGTVTLTNFGMTGALMGVPIIRHPEVAIIGAGTIQKRIVVRDDDSFAARQMMYLTLTFDHRVIDGIYGCEFLAHFKQNLESISGI